MKMYLIALATLLGGTLPVSAEEWSLTGPQGEEYWLSMSTLPDIYGTMVHLVVNVPANAPSLDTQEAKDFVNSIFEQHCAQTGSIVSSQYVEDSSKQRVDVHKWNGKRLVTWEFLRHCVAAE